MKKLWTDIYYNEGLIGLICATIFFCSIAISFEIGDQKGYHRAEAEYLPQLYPSFHDREPTVTMMVKDYPMMELIDKLQNVGYTWAILPGIAGKHYEKFKPVTLTAWEMPVSKLIKEAFQNQPGLTATILNNTIWIHKIKPQ
jgi:hypothetical protein